MDQIQDLQCGDEKQRVICDKVQSGEANIAFVNPNGVLRIGGCVCVLGVGDQIRLILEEPHYLKYFIHQGEVRMYHCLKQHNWWCGMKKDIVAFMDKCLNYQQVKYKHQ